MGEWGMGNGEMQEAEIVAILDRSVSGLEWLGRWRLGAFGDLEIWRFVGFDGEVWGLVEWVWIGWMELGWVGLLNGF